MDETKFQLLQKVKEAHSRIIWGISWAHDSSLFATCSRENKDSVKVWCGPVDESTVGTLHSSFPDKSVPAATAIAFFPRRNYTLLIGQESGELTIWALEAAANAEKRTWTKLH